MKQTREPANADLNLPAGWSVQFSDSAPSSNDLALDCLHQHGQLAAGRCFVVAEQTKGRGRLGRNWTSRPGDGLYLSAVLCPEAEKKAWPSLSFAVSLAVYQTLFEYLPDRQAKLELKWPNDVLANNGKIAGILLEAGKDGVIAGCGINLRNAPADASQKHAAVSLDSFCDENSLPTPYDLAFRLVHKIAGCYETWAEKGHHAIIDAWKGHSTMIGKQVRIQTPSGECQGRCKEIGMDGQLILVAADGQDLIITAGDVEIMKGLA